MKHNNLTVGYYQPTEAFQLIPAHTAVMDADDQTLVALTGPQGDKDSEEAARLFSVSPAMLKALQAAEIADKADDPMNDVNEIIDALVKMGEEARWYSCENLHTWAAELRCKALEKL
jgi:hypothetical protein